MDQSQSADKKKPSFSWLFCCTNGSIPAAVATSKLSPADTHSQENKYHDDDEEKQVPEPQKSGVFVQTKPGWKVMPYILGNETFERLASIGLQANFMMFMMTQFHLNQVSASNVLNIWNAVGNFLPLFGAFLADAFLGRFLTISFSSISSFLGLVTLTLIAWLPTLHPPPCNFQANPKSCKGPKSTQMGTLYLALGLLSIGSAGIRPCSIPFGVDQFDQTTVKGRKGLNSYFNWYYTSFTIVLIFAVTVMVYIQDNLSWVYGFGIPCVLMFLAVVLFFVGAKLYEHVQPQGSVFMDIAQALVAAYKKRKLNLPFDNNGDIDHHAVFYDPPVAGTCKLPLTHHFRFLNKAAIIVEGELKEDGRRAEKWRISSIQTIEEIKCLLRIIPIWASGIICFTALTQQTTFSISQASKMDRHLGPKFQIPPGTLPVISFITVGVFLPIYDRLIVPFLRRRTMIEGGITLLQRMGIGIVFSVLSMVAAGVIEKKRRNLAIAHPNPYGIAPITVFWLAPQFILMGLSEAFNLLGQIEFYNKEFPDSMISLANSLFSVTMAGANYISLIIVNVVHHTTGRNGHPDWLTENINAGKLENFYYVLAGLGLLNFGYYLAVAPGYKYKSRVLVEKEESGFINIELSGNKQ